MTPDTRFCSRSGRNVPIVKTPTAGFADGGLAASIVDGGGGLIMRMLAERPRFIADGSVSSARGGEELERKVVRIAERQARAVRSGDNAPVVDAESVETQLPLLKFAPIGARERDVIEARPSRIERQTGGNWVGELVQAEQRRAEAPNDVAERAGVLVQDRLGAEEFRVPRDAYGEIAHGECNMSDRWEVRHSFLLEVGDVQPAASPSTEHRPMVDTRISAESRGRAAELARSRFMRRKPILNPLRTPDVRRIPFELQTPVASANPIGRATRRNAHAS
jgi:hypothetical protein